MTETPALRVRTGAPLVAALALAACTGVDRAAQEPLLVMAAASLNTAMPALVDRFRAESGLESSLVLGATGSLATQIEQGAPGDVFFSADEATVTRLAETGYLRKASVRTYATGRLVVVWRGGAPALRSPLDLAADPYRTVAIANPEHAPYGAAARDVLRKLGLWDTLGPRLVQSENVAQALQFVRTGNADAGLVALSVVDGTAAPHVLVADSLHPPIRQAAGVLARATHPGAQAFLDFVLGPSGQEILSLHGFGPGGV